MFSEETLTGVRRMTSRAYLTFRPLGFRYVLSLTGISRDYDIAQINETVAGLLAQSLGRVPIAGSAATVRGLRLTAENLAGRRNKIGTVLVERENEDAP